MPQPKRFKPGEWNMIATKVLVRLSENYTTKEFAFLQTFIASGAAVIDEVQKKPELEAVRP